MALPGTETVRFRRPTAGPNAVAPKAEPAKDQFGSMAPQGWKRRHQGILQDKVGRQTRGPIVPSLSAAFRLLWLVRTAAAMYAIISDCDEVFNFYEPLHYFQHNSGFQTWELSPQFAVRSWAYVLLHWPFAHLGPLILRLGKRQQFFALRICLAAVSSFCEAKFFRAVVEVVHERVGRYMLFAMAFSAGMWGSSVAFLPSTFTMYMSLLAASWWFHPATSTAQGQTRAFRATFAIALGAIVGWPFSAALGIPFVIEQLFLTGGEIAVGPDRQALRTKRWATLTRAVALSACIAIPVYLIDSWAYGRSTLPTLNILLYNVFTSSGGPELYGTSPWWYYLANLSLNFNYLVPFALLSLPGLGVTYRYDRRRLGKTQQAPKPGETSPYTLLVLRLMPFYIWLAVLTAQPHKEERFFYPAYPFLCFNAAVGVYLVKSWMESAYIAITNSPYKASKTTVFSNFSLFAILIPCLISMSRIVALHKFYHAPFDIIHYFEYNTVPDILGSLGYSPQPAVKNYVPSSEGESAPLVWDYSPIKTLEKPVRLCYGTEWHRYPSSYLVVEGVDVQWIKTEFDGMMPRRWEASEAQSGSWPRSETRIVRPGRFNGDNKASAEPGTYVEPQTCDYLVALHLLSSPPNPLEPDWASKPEWEREYCQPFLDAAGSAWWSRLIWLPGGFLEEGRSWGEYCLLKRAEGYKEKA
ncbi:putative mannosyltransferase [Naematelia encephala]|uniref:Mannosyltransferase n=1 Tax=Naematelia encephala TaxID=71784 RepID=A0A1Y2ANW9_9TREE|nr:putative mannosyltransferase [Naematelia encephala]